MKLSRSNVNGTNEKVVKLGVRVSALLYLVMAGFLSASLFTASSVAKTASCAAYTPEATSMGNISMGTEIYLSSCENTLVIVLSRSAVIGLPSSLVAGTLMVALGISTVNPVLPTKNESCISTT